MEGILRLFSGIVVLSTILCVSGYSDQTRLEPTWHDAKHGLNSKQVQFYRAAYHGDVSALQALIDEGMSCDMRLADEGSLSTPIMWAARTGQIEVIKLLAKCGGVLGNSNQDNLLHMAATHGHPELAQYLLRTTSLKPDTHSSMTGFSPMHKVCYGATEGHAAVLLLFLQLGVDPFVLNAHGHDCLSSARGKTKAVIEKWIKDHPKDNSKKYGLPATEWTVETVKSSEDELEDAKRQMRRSDL